MRFTIFLLVVVVAAARCSVRDLKKDSCISEMRASPMCTAGERPKFTRSCCLDCKKAAPQEGERKVPCKCSTAHKDLPSCAQGVGPTFNATTCCRSCKPAPKVERKDRPNGRCTKDQYKNCSRTLEACKPLETPMPTEGCCQSCKLPAEKCNATEIIKQCTELPACEADEIPQLIEDACCYSCKVRPNCTGPDNGKVCTRAGWKRKRLRKLKLRVAKKLTDSATGNVTKQQVQTLLKALIKKFCSRTDNNRQVICDNMGPFLDALKVKTLRELRKGKAGRGGKINEHDDVVDTEVEVEVEDDATSTRRALLSTSDLLDSALGDSEATDNAVDDITGSPAGSNPNSASTLAFSFAAFAWAFF